MPATQQTRIPSRFYLGSAQRVMLEYLADRGPLTDAGPADRFIARSLLTDGLAVWSEDDTTLSITDHGRAVRAA